MLCRTRQNARRYLSVRLCKKVQIEAADSRPLFSQSWQTSGTEYSAIDSCTRRSILIQMYRQPLNPLAPNDALKGPSAESHELLLSAPHRQLNNPYPRDDDPRRHSKLSTSWRAYWKTPATMAALFLAGPYSFTMATFEAFLTFRSFSMHNRSNSSRRVPSARHKKDGWSRFYPAELCSNAFAPSRTSLPGNSLRLLDHRLHAIPLALDEDNDS